MSKTLQEFVEESAHINLQFKNKWSIELRLLNLSEEVGELSHDVLIKEGNKNAAPYAKSIGANLSNLLYEIFLIANHYDIDLDNSWKDFLKIMPSWIKQRNKK